MTALEKAHEIVRILDQKKGRDIQMLEIGNLSTLGDYFILATGGSSTQVKSLSEDIDDEMHKHHGLNPDRIEGQQSAQWILMDYGDVMVHIFQEEARAFYALERLWNDAPKTDLSGILTQD